MTEDAGLALLDRFSSVTAKAMAERGWDFEHHRPAEDRSVLLRPFSQAIATDWVATVEFILESGPTTSGFEVGLSGLRHVHRFEATIGGELGLRHLPTARLLNALDVRSESNITLDLADIFADEGRELPVMTDARSVDETCRALVAVVDARALPFARQHADVDAVVAFIATGKQLNRSPEFEYLFVPALLAASGRRTAARMALADFEERPKSGPPDEEAYAKYAAALSSWLATPSASA